MFKQAADAGHAAAMYNLSQCYKLGLGTDVDAQRSYEWVSKAAANMLPEALRVQGDMLMHGTPPVEESAAAAVMCYKRAAEAGDAEAMRLLAACLTHGKGVCGDLICALHRGSCLALHSRNLRSRAP